MRYAKTEFTIIDKVTRVSHSVLNIIPIVSRLDVFNLIATSKTIMKLYQVLDITLLFHVRISDAWIHAKSKLTID